MDRSEAGENEGATPPPTSVGDAEPPASCPHCGRPFPEARLRTLHLGLEHPDRLTEPQRTAFEAAYLDEQAEIRRFRLWLLATLILTYFCLLFVYAVVT